MCEQDGQIVTVTKSHWMRPETMILFNAVMVVPEIERRREILYKRGYRNLVASIIDDSYGVHDNVDADVLLEGIVPIVLDVIETVILGVIALNEDMDDPSLSTTEPQSQSQAERSTLQSVEVSSGNVIAVWPDTVGLTTVLDDPYWLFQVRVCRCCLPTHPPTHRPAHVPTCLLRACPPARVPALPTGVARLPARLPAHLPACLPAHPPTHPPTRPFVCLSVYLSMCVSVR
eukprot:COSAG06_NODE_405_length_16132_cov_9.166532_11_plen_231_part_00